MKIDPLTVILTAALILAVFPACTSSDIQSQHAAAVTAAHYRHARGESDQ